MFNCPDCQAPCVVETRDQNVWMLVTCTLCSFRGTYNPKLGWRMKRSEQPEAP